MIRVSGFAGLGIKCWSSSGPICYEVGWQTEALVYRALSGTWGYGQYTSCIIILVLLPGDPKTCRFIGSTL